MLLDFFVEAPGRGGGSRRCGPSCPGQRLVRRRDPGVQHRRRVGRRVRPAGGPVRGGRAVRQLPLSELVRPGAALARDGVALNRAAGLRRRDPRRHRHRDAGVRGAVRAGRDAAARRRRDPPAGARGRARAARRRRGRAVLQRRHRGRDRRVGGRARRHADRGGSRRRTRSSIASPSTPSYRGREVLTNPPPSAGGILIAHALGLLDAMPGPPRVERIVAAMERTQAARTPEFLDGLADPGFVEQFLASPPRRPARVDDAHRRARPRRLGVLGHVLERRELGRRRSRHGRAPQQHARRAGSEPARVPPPRPRAPAAVA